MDFKDYYKILSVEADAENTQIKTAYRKLARKYHPDMNPDKGAEDKFKDVAEAYHVLKDAQRRAEFDELRATGGQQKQGFQMPPDWQGSTGGPRSGSAQFDSDYSDFFNSLFGARQQRTHTQGRDVEVELALMLEDTVADAVKTIEFYLPKNDSGKNEKIKKHLKVTIPKGAVDGEVVRLKGQGWPSYQGAAAGDLYLHVRVIPHPFFEVEGHNLLLALPLAPWEAALGAKVVVPTLTGSISVSIPPNTQAGKKLRIKGKGLSHRNAPPTEDFGDLYVVVKIVMPIKCDEASLKIWRELAGHEKFNPRAEWSSPL